MKMTVLGILSGIIMVMQSFVHIKFGVFSISVVLVPVVIGGILYGIGSGCFLGFVFGLAVLLSGDAAFYLAMSIPGTVITVLSKGILCGAASAAVYRLIHRKNEKAAMRSGTAAASAAARSSWTPAVSSAGR